MPGSGIQLVPEGVTPTDPYTLSNDLGSTTPGLGASLIGVSPNGCFDSTNVQDALEEICAGGGGGGPTTADQVSITDAGGYYTSDNVEGALQEIGSARGAANGIATLDAFGKVPSSQLSIPEPIYFEGTWDALTNTPDISVGPTEGATWIVNVAGNTNLGGITDWNVGDWAIFHDGGWFKIDNTASATVISVNGYIGAVVLTKSDIGLGNVEDTALSTWPGSTNLVTLGTVTTGTWNGTAVGPTHGGTGLTSYALGDTVYASATNTLSKLAGNTTTTKKFLSQTGTGLVSAAPSWDAVAAADVSVADAGNYFTGTTVEAALQEVGATGLLNGVLTLSTAAVQSVTSTATQLTPTSTIHRINNITGGNITLASTPSIATAGATLGRFLIVYHAGAASANNVVFSRGATTAMKVSASSRTLAPGGILGLMFDGTNWVEMFFIQSNTAP